MSKKYQDSAYRPQIHLAPPQGWLNDPNGLCQVNGVYHIFFQYSPDDPEGGDKYWGHYETADFAHYTFTGSILSPDTPEDKDGVYSGCAYVEDGTMYLYYTGNVKNPGDYDYIYSGREANTILVTSRDGREASKKEVLLKTADYPSSLSNHVRDPKVFRKDGTYYMVLGARTKQDEGCVLFFTSSDKRSWEFSHFIERKNFGYMWECPDLFSLDGKQFLSCCPQGLEAEEDRFQNVYQSGYFTTVGDLLTDGTALGSFAEWDYGFDFYAPQSFLDESGRRILIGWMGVPDVEYDHDPSIGEGWQHMLTLPRELTYDPAHGRILQNPIRELTKLRAAQPIEVPGAKGEEDRSFSLDAPYELLLEGLGGDDFALILDEGLQLSFERQSGIVRLSFAAEEGEKIGFGRTERRLRLPEGEAITDIHMFADTCCVEIYLNHGAYVFTTKYFSEAGGARSLVLRGDAGAGQIYPLKPFAIRL